MDLSDLDIGPRPQQPYSPVELTFVREITPEDVEARAAAKGTLYKAPLKRLTHRHHALARCIAAGNSGSEAAMIVGYDAVTVSILLGNPAFMELVNFYARDINRVYAEMQANMAALGSDVVDELRDRLETAPEEFTNSQLTDLMAKTADRTGNGPQSTSVQVNIHANLADRLAEARRRAAAASKVIEGEANAA